LNELDYLFLKQETKCLFTRVFLVGTEGIACETPGVFTDLISTSLLRQEEAGKTGELQARLGGEGGVDVGRVRRGVSPLIRCAMVKSRYIGEFTHPTFNRNPYNAEIKTYYKVDEFIPYYMEIMGLFLEGPMILRA